MDALEGTSDTSGSVTGLPITATHVRELLQRLRALGLQPPDGESLTFAITDADGRLLATTSRATLEPLARRGCPEHPDGRCGCSVLDRPPPTDAYTPTDAQHAFITTRDRACRFPSVRREALIDRVEVKDLHR